MVNRRLYTKNRRKECLKTLASMVLGLKPTLRPRMDVTKYFREEVLELTRFMKVLEAAHVKYITEEGGVDLKETANEEYQNAVDNAYELLHPSAPDLEEIMADVENQNKEELEVIRKIDFLQTYEEDLEIHTMETIEIEVKENPTSKAEEAPEDNKPEYALFLNAGHENDENSCDKLNEKLDKENNSVEHLTDSSDANFIHENLVKCKVCEGSIESNSSLKKHFKLKHGQL